MFFKPVKFALSHCNMLLYSRNPPKNFMQSKLHGGKIEFEFYGTKFKFNSILKIFCRVSLKNSPLKSLINIVNFRIPKYFRITEKYKNNVWCPKVVFSDVVKLQSIEFFGKHLRTYDFWLQTTHDTINLNYENSLMTYKVSS